MTHPTSATLIAAATIMRQRGNTWAANALSDMSNKLARYGRFASDKQAAFATKLVNEANAPQCDKQPPSNTIIPMPRVTQAMKISPRGKFHRLEIERIIIVCKSDYSFAWICDKSIPNPSYPGRGKVIGKLEPLAAVANVWSTDPTLHDTLRAFEHDPILLASTFGRATGRCSCCGRTLTDPNSISAGIGPICAAGF